FIILGKSACNMALHFGLTRDAMYMIFDMLVQLTPEELRHGLNETMNEFDYQIFNQDDDGFAADTSYLDFVDEDEHESAEAADAAPQTGE
ncbi:MAG: hypothetical protein J5963_06775, partial [Schwartzia sp.]|nr:hypothetical protein [Schwartzia sp. (in: firmicutes)]